MSRNMLRKLLTRLLACRVNDAFVTGIKGVVAEDVATRRPVVEGVYNLSGVKVGNSMENLPKGLYIVNGKKFIVK